MGILKDKGLTRKERRNLRRDDIIWTHITQVVDLRTQNSFLRSHVCACVLEDLDKVAPIRDAP